jgi:hypothetical protein
MRHVMCIAAVALAAGCANKQAAPAAPTEDAGAAAAADPFGAPPLPAEFNCGPEERYEFDATIASAEDFAAFLEGHEIGDWVKLDSFKDEAGEVDWDAVAAAVETGQVGGRTVYSLVYVPFDCSEYTVKMTGDGHVSVYGCCGK